MNFLPGIERTMIVEKIFFLRKIDAREQDGVDLDRDVYGMLVSVNASAIAFENRNLSNIIIFEFIVQSCDHALSLKG